MDNTGLGIFAFLVELAGIHQLSELLVRLHGLDQAVKNVLSVVGVFTVIFGILQCFLGYKLFKFWCGFIGLIVGSSLGFAIAASGVFSGSLAANLIGLFVIVILAITGALIAYRAYLVGLFIYVFSAAFILGFLLIAAITNSIIAGLLVGLAAAITMGILAVIHRRFWIILSTSVAGGISVGTSVLMVIQSTDYIWGYILPPIFIVAGFIVQNKTVKKEHGKDTKNLAEYSKQETD